MNRPALTRKRLQALWMSVQLARGESALMSDEEAREHNVESAWDYVRQLRRWWEEEHGVDLFGLHSPYDN